MDIRTIVCRYCKKHGHTKEVCRKLKNVTSQRSENSATFSWEYQDRRHFIHRNVLTVSVRQTLSNDHNLPKFTNYSTDHTIQLLIDSGSDLNLIKLSAPKDEVMVYDDTIYQFKGITEHSVQTLGSVTLQIQIGTKTFPTEFHLVHDNFLKFGILGKFFIIGRQAVINYRTKELIITDTSKLTSQSRTETIVAVPVPNIAKNSSVIVNTQNIMDDVISGNCVTIVRNQSVYVLLINPYRKFNFNPNSNFRELEPRGI